MTMPPHEPVRAAPGVAHARADAIVLAAWDAHHDELFAFLVRTTRDRAVAEDLLQDAYLRLMRSARDGLPPDNPRAWLYRVAANLAVSRGRRVGAALRWVARTALASSDREASDDPPEAGLLAREARGELIAAMAGLRPEARIALLLASEGFNGVEIAACIGRSETATRTLMCRARRTLRERLEAAEGVR
jgi:RNA polymerase sigma factor (sigma-70 family)